MTTHPLLRGGSRAQARLPLLRWRASSVLLRSASLVFAAWVLVYPELTRAELKAQEIPQASGPTFEVLSVSGETGCFPLGVRDPLLLGQHEQVVQQGGVDPKLAVLLSFDIPSCGDVYYLPVKNETLGLGYQHTEGSELFDHSPRTALEGLIFLNDLAYWEDNPAELRELFLHEVGHRWGARVQLPRHPANRLLGRDERHWSAFLDSERSPLEGNSWEPNSSTTSSHRTPPRYSHLDLYLMGQLPAAEVGPLRWFAANEADQQRDCRGRALSAASPPQDCGPMTLAGNWREFSVEDIIAAEGPRMPPRGPMELSVAFYLTAPRGSAWSEEECSVWGERLRSLLGDFHTATGERMTLSLLTQGGTCEEVREFLSAQNRAEPESSPAAACSLHAPSGGARAAWWWFTLLPIGATVRRWARARGSRSKSGKGPVPGAADSTQIARFGNKLRHSRTRIAWKR